jgi:DNA-binding transcriptional MerR regulator
MRIGEFAAASGVPVKTLRFYDELGLLRPAGKHPLTGYRDYAPTQLAEIAAILALREIGVPLDEIRATLRIDSPAGRRTLLERARRGLRQAIEENSRSLAWVEIELRRTPDPSVTMRRRPPLRVASLRARLGEYRDIAELERELLARVPERLRGKGRGTLWHACDDPATIDAEHFVEILAPPPARTRATVQTLPAMSAACAFSRDDENASLETFAAVRRWLETRGLQLVASKREMYWPGMLEIQFPFALS